MNFKFFVASVLIFITGITNNWAKLDFGESRLQVTIEPNEKEKIVKFPFQNKSDKKIRIVGVKASCGCTIADLNKKEYEPDESGELKVTYKSRKHTDSEIKSIIIVTDEDEENFYNLRLEIYHKQAMSISPKTLHWELGIQSEEKIIKIEIDPSYDFHLTEVTSSNDVFLTKLKTIEPYNKYEIEVEPIRYDLSASGLLRLHTNNPDMPIFHIKVDIK